MLEKVKGKRSIHVKEKQTSFMKKMEDDLKNSIFNILYALLKDEETPHWKHILVILIDYIQIYHYSFATQLDYPWKSESILEYLQTFLSFFKIRYWMEKLDYTSFIVFFYIAIFIICVILMGIAYVKYSLNKKKFTFVWPLQALRSICGLIITVLFLPIIETLVLMIDCHLNFDLGKEIHEVYQEIECWKGYHIIHATFAVLFSAIFILLTLVLSLTYYNNRSNSQSISAKVNSRADVFNIIMKVILTALYAFFNRSNYQWLIIGILFILSFISYINYKIHWPYFNDKMNKFFCVLTGIFLWANFVLLIAKILEKTDFSGSLQLYFLGLPLIIGLAIFEKDERITILLKNINNFQKGEEVGLQIRYFLHLVQLKDQDRNSSIILRGYIYHHEDLCPNQECQLKLYKNSQLQNSKHRKQIKKNNLNSSHFENNQLLLLHAKNLFRLGIQKFPTYTPLRLYYAFFLMNFMQKKVESVLELNQASLFFPPFDEQFIIYRYLKISEEFGDGPNNLSQEQGGSLVQTMSKYAYEASLRQLQNHIEKSATLHFEFWNHLRDDRPDISKLNECGSKINQSIILVDQYWNQVQKLNGNDPKALKLYSKFLIEILNDSEGGQELQARAKDAANIKVNFFNSNNINDDLSDINDISINGIPCIYVSGDNDKIGLVNQSNQSACRIFGYTSHEIKNHNVEKLMPEMYAKNHSKILDEALAKGPENIPNKERLVFARHKSGYVFPVWLQLKMVQNTSSGIQFVALFKIDKKIMSSSVSYILLNKDKKIHGISSGCIKMINLDIQKMRRLTLSGIDINQLAPTLFDQDHNDQNFYQKSGGQLDWFLPDFEKYRRNRNLSQQASLHNNKRAETLKQNKDQDNKRGIIITDQKISLQCNLNKIIMGNLGEIGWYLKLENFNKSKISMSNQNQKTREKLKQPLFQFRYDGPSGKFIRELKENLFVDDAAKNPIFVHRRWNELFTDPEESIHSQNLINLPHQESFNSSPKVQKSEAEDKSDIRKENEDLLEKKKRWGKNISTYRLVAGKFLSKEQDEEMQKQKEAEQNKKKKDQEEENQFQNFDGQKSTIKSRKALQIAINDKTTPKAIRNLRLTMNFVLACLLALAITEFTIINSQFNDINENFNLIQKSYGRISEVQRIAYNVRTLVLINEKKQTVYKNYTTLPDFIQFLKLDIESALNNLYDLQNSIALTTVPMTNAQNNLIGSKVVNLYFKETNNTLKKLVFTLTEAVLQVSSAMFTARHLNSTLYKEEQEDIFFITYNTFNDFLLALRNSSDYYEQDLYSRTDQKGEVILIIFLASSGTLILAIAILFPVVSNVNLARMKILSLFVDIPNHHVIELSARSEKFLSSFHEEHNDEMESEDGANIKPEDEELINKSLKRGVHKIPKNSKGSNKTFFIQSSIGAIIIFAYYLAMFILSYQYLENIQSLASQMGTLASAEQKYAFSHNVLREMIYNNKKPVLGQNSFDVLQEILSQSQLYSLNEKILDQFQSNKDILNENYIQIFEQLYLTNNCQLTEKIKLNLIPYDCNTFISGAATHGLQTILVRYFETQKEVLNEYLRMMNKDGGVQKLYDSNYFLELFIMQSRFIQDSFRVLVQTMKQSVNEDYNTRFDSRMAAFIIFIIGLIVCYLMLWTPFVNKLNNEIWRTKSMLTIIPIEVILKIPRIQEFLHSQSFFTNKQKQAKEK